MNLRYFLPLYFFVYVLVAFVWRSYLVWKRTGINPITFKSSDTAHDFIGRVFKLVFVFGISRNPIFVGMMLTLLGLFLTLPNALTLLAFVLGVILIGVQVRLEEEYLAQIHPEAYLEYRQRVRRWL